MYDRPTLTELLDAVRGHLEAQIIPVIKGDAKLYFQTLVAINVLRVAERELALGHAHQQAEWERLGALLNDDGPPPADPAQARAALAARTQQLCAHIRAGTYDQDDARLFTHLMLVTREALEVANPKLLQTLAVEDDAV